MTVSKSETEKLGTKIPFLGNWWKVEIGWITFGVFPSEDLVAWCRPVCLGTYLLALNTRFDSLDLDFHFFFKTQPPRLIPVKGGFFRLFSVQKFVFQGHMIKKRGAWRRIWIPFWMLDYRILSLTQSLGTKKMAPPQKRGDETWGTKRLEVSDLIDWLMMAKNIGSIERIMAVSQSSDWCYHVGCLFSAKDSDSTEIPSKVRGGELIRVAAASNRFTWHHDSWCPLMCVCS